MSKKTLGKRRSRTEIPSAAVNAPLGTLTECIDRGPSGCDLSSISSCTSKILFLATSEGSERKALTHRASGGINTLLKTLKITEDQVVVSNILSILNVLANYKYVGHMIRDGAVMVVLNSLVDTYHSHKSSQDLLIAHVSLINKISYKDRKFGLKARLSGSLPVIFKLLKNVQDDYEKLITVLSLLKSVSQSSVNAMCLGKLGTIKFLVNMISKNSQTNLIVVKHCIDILVRLFKIKTNVAKPIAQECVKQLLHLHQMLRRIDIGSRHILVRKKILQCLKLCIAFETNLQVFHRNGGLQVLYSSASEEKKKRSDSYALESLTCMVLRRGLPPVDLPLESMTNTIHFPLPQKPELETDQISESSSAKTSTSDLVLPQSCSKELEPQPAIDEGLCINGISLSKASTSLEPIPSKKLECDFSAALLERYSTSDSINMSNEVFSDECINSHGMGLANSSKGSRSKFVSMLTIPSSAASDIDIKIDKNLEQFVGYFPELDEIKHYWFPLKSLPTSSEYNSDKELQWDEKKEGCSSQPGSMEDIEVINSKEKTMASQFPLNGMVSNKVPVKSVINFVEESVPQQLSTILPPTSDEPQYSKRASVDRKLSLSDIERITNPKLIINKIVFDLDSLLQQSSDKISQVELCETLGSISSGFCHQNITGTNQRSTSTYTNIAFSGIDPVSIHSVGASRSANPMPVCDSSPLTSANVAATDYDDELLCTSLTDLAMLQEVYSSEDDMEVGSEKALTSDSSNEQVKMTNGFSAPNGKLDHISSHLEFESRFESGNLRKAIQVRQYEYDLLLNADINTNHHHQWFYFRVSNNEARVPYRFNIINCEKPNSQFNYGMQPVMFSVTAANQKQQGWVRAGTRISYYKNNFTVLGDSTKNDWKKKRKAYYTLTFTITFQHKMDTCYFAYHYPYTFSMLQMDLEAIEANLKSKDLYYHRQPLCTTLCGNICPLITIASDQTSQHLQKELDSRHYVVLSARVHPGESNSSWIMRGLLNYLTSDCPGARALREKYIFKIIPMLNPDGVIHGSHRCSLCGEDLNRQWIDPDPVLHPTIYHMKSLLHWLVQTNRRPEVFCDFHGHSRRKNVFMFGCKTEFGHGMEQSVPMVMDKIASFFSYRNCSFAVEKSKEATARVVVWRELGVVRSYTMESTYCGADQGQNRGRQINILDLEEVGVNFCKSLLHLDDYSDIPYGQTLLQSKSEDTLSSHSDSSSNKFMSGDEDSSGSGSEDQ